MKDMQVAPTGHPTSSQISISNKITLTHTLETRKKLTADVILLFAIIGIFIMMLEEELTMQHLMDKVGLCYI